MVKRYTLWDDFGRIHPGEHDVDASGDWVIYDDYAALEARVAELEKGAARYRWIMDCDDFEAVIEVLSLGSDDAIDRAMSREA